MSKLSFLQPGDLIYVAAPAGKVSPEEILPAVEWLRQQGYGVIMGKHIFSGSFQYAGTDDERISDLRAALDNPDVRALIFARGGYGTIRIINDLNFDKFLLSPKWLVGFSDITILHNACARLKVPSVHGPMLKGSMEKDGLPTQSMKSLMGLLTGEKAEYRVESNTYNRTGDTTAILTGGNLSILYSLLGTPYDLDTRGKILFIEDTGEYLYHTDRMMISLKLAGKLEGLKGIVAGQFSKVKDNDEPFGKTIEEIIMEAAGEYDYPVCFGFPAGHGSPNMPIMLGHPWNLSVTDNGSFLNMA
jgi:muramoyltetrapeptide carboxypeptidase